MRCTLLLLIACLLSPSISAAQDDGNSRKSTPAQLAAASQSYVILLTEFRLKTPAAATLSPADIVRMFEQRKDDSEFEVVETIRLSALERHESMVQFGKKTAVTVGSVTSARGGVQRQTQERMEGTTVRVTVEPQAGKTLLKLFYEASRLVGEGTADSPPDTVMVQFNTTLFVESGQSKLVGGISAPTGSYLMVALAQ